MKRKNTELSINILGYDLPVKIKSYKTARTVKVLVKRNGEITLTKPVFISVSKAYHFLESKTEFISQSFSDFAIKLPLSDNSINKKGNSHYLKYKERARAVVKRKVEEINKLYGFKVGRISIRDQSTRWGSCSSGGNLNFNYRAVFLEEDGLNYLIAHELCHLKEFNHSKDFWNLVAKASPNYRIWRKKLRKNLDFDLNAND